MKIHSFEIGPRELAGSFGGWGTIIPLMLGYVTICRLDLGALLVLLGLTNVLLGMIYRLPLPLEPMKVLAVVAIAQAWSPSLIYASGFAMGVIWLILALTGAVTWLKDIIPIVVIRGIQLSLAILLAIQALKMLTSWLSVGIISFTIALLLRKSRYAPAGIVLIGLGILLVYSQGHLAHLGAPSLHLPRITFFTLEETLQSFLLAGFAQLPLTVTNAIIVTAAMVKEYWPERVVTEKQLALNHGVINLIAPFFGGMPMCHGAGGLAGKYSFGARSGGASIMEGSLEIVLGLFFAALLSKILIHFPAAILGVMLLFASWELGKLSRGSWQGRDIAVISITVISSTYFSMAVGFLAGLMAYYILLRVYPVKSA